jgi:hypothetical protein
MMLSAVVRVLRGGARGAGAEEQGGEECFHHGNALSFRGKDCRYIDRGFSERKRL